MGDKKKNFADAELENEMGFFKEPSVRLKNVEAEANKCKEEGDMEKALFLGMQQLALAKLCYEDPSTIDREVVLGRAHLNLSNIYHDMGLGDQAFFHGQKAIERVDPRKTGEGENNDMTISTLMAVAKAMIQRCDPKCVNYLQRALVINHELHGPDHDSNFSIHEGFGDFYVNLGDSRALYKEIQSSKAKETAVDVNEKKGDKERDDYQKAMDEYAIAYEKIAGSGRRANAFYSGGTKDGRMGNMFGKAAKFWMKVLDESFVQQCRSKQGSDEEAATIYEKAIACLEYASRPNKAKLAQMYYELGITYHKIKKYSYSMDACKNAIGYVIGDKKEGEKNGQEPLLLLVKKQQAITYYDGNEVENAKAMFEELMALQRKEYGGSSVIIAETLKYMGDVHVALKDKSQAAKFYNRALHILKKRLGSTDQTVKQLEQYIKQLNLKD